MKLHLENEYPRASITTRLGRLGGRSLYYGPFVSRVAAEKFMNDSLDFFKMRRCVDDLHPDPKFPGCIYSEMKMCLAPCFKGCSDEEYAAEVNRVQAYFDSGGDSLLRELSAEREAASARLAFEDAAAIHARVEKLKPILSQLPGNRAPPRPSLRADDSAELILRDRLRSFASSAGRISGPIPFSIQSAGARKVAVDGIAGAGGAAIHSRQRKRSRRSETMEHLALLKRWFYRGSRTGEIFFADAKGELPMRRIVRGISRVFRGEKPRDRNSAHPQLAQSRDPVVDRASHATASLLR